MIKITAFVLASLLVIVVVKQINKEFAIFTSLASALIIFLLIITDYKSLFDSLTSITKEIKSANSYVSLMIKLLGITLISQFTIDLCRDAGENALATQTEIASKIVILIMVLPLFETILNIISGLVK